MIITHTVGRIFQNKKGHRSTMALGSFYNMVDEIRHTNTYCANCQVHCIILFKKVNTIGPVHILCEMPRKLHSFCATFSA